MKPTALALAAGAVLLVPAGAIGKALDFGDLAQYVTLVVVMLLASLVDREWFWGAGGPE
jgi:hypothetical protein